MTPSTSEKNVWFIYLIEAENGMIYTGISKDVLRRFEEHKSSKKGAKFFRRSAPRKILSIEGPVSLSQALKREHEIKKMKRAQKLKYALCKMPSLIK